MNGEASIAERADPPIPATIADEAAHWIAQGEGRTLSDEERARLERWLEADPRHARAYREMCDIWDRMGAIEETPALRAVMPRAALSPPRRRTIFRHAHMTRPGAKKAAAASAAACLALVITGTVQDWPTRLQADAMTDVGETRAVALPDGSVVQLGTDSAISYDYDDAGREIALLKGEAVFSVAADASRPFRVEAGGGSTTALGTQFLVRRDGDSTRVTVTEHKVRVRYSGAMDAPLVREGQTVRYGPDAIGPVRETDADDAIAWTEGVLMFNDRPLSEVVSEIGRYRHGYLRVTGDARDMRISGVFNVKDPDVAIEQLRRSFGLKVTRYTDWFVTISG